MSERVAGFAAGIAIRLLLRSLRKKRKHLEQAAPPQLTREQIDQYIVDTTIDEAYEQLQAEYDRAYNELLQREKEVEDPYIKKLIQKIKRRHELFRPDNTMRPPWMLAAILLNEALKHGVKDREKIYQYILKASWEYAKQIAQILPTKEYQGKHQQAYADLMRNPYETLNELTSMIHEANKDDPIWKKYWDYFGIVAEKVWEAVKGDVSPSKDHHKISQYIEVFDKTVSEAEKEAIKKLGIEPFWHKTPEEILGIKPEEPEEKEEGPLSSYRAWLVGYLASKLQGMDAEEIANLIVSCCGGECVLKRLGSQT